MRMLIKISRVILLGIGVLWGSVTLAQELEIFDGLPAAGEQREQLRQYWDKLSPEERQTLLERMIQWFKAIPPEQKQQMHDRLNQYWQNLTRGERSERRAELLEQWRNMPPEQKQWLRNQLDDWRRSIPSK